MASEGSRGFVAGAVTASLVWIAIGAYVFLAGFAVIATQQVIEFSKDRVVSIWNRMVDQTVAASGGKPQDVDGLVVTLAEDRSRTETLEDIDIFFCGAADNLVAARTIAPEAVALYERLSPPDQPYGRVRLRSWSLGAEERAAFGGAVVVFLDTPADGAEPGFDERALAGRIAARIEARSGGVELVEQTYAAGARPQTLYYLSVVFCD